MILVLSTRSIAAGPSTRAEAWWLLVGMRDLSGTSIARPAGGMVVVFIDPECPVSNGYIPTMNALAAEFSKRGFVFLGAYADPNADLAGLRRHVESYNLKFVAIDDRSQRLARYCAATYTPQAVVISPEGHVLYRGRIDDRVGEGGAARPAAVRSDLQDVLRKLVSGEQGPFPSKQGFGCLLPERVEIAAP